MEYISTPFVHTLFHRQACEGRTHRTIYMMDCRRGAGGVCSFGTAHVGGALLCSTVPGSHRPHPTPAARRWRAHGPAAPDLPLANPCKCALLPHPLAAGTMPATRTFAVGLRSSHEELGAGLAGATAALPLPRGRSGDGACGVNAFARGCGCTNAHMVCWWCKRLCLTMRPRASAWELHCCGPNARRASCGPLRVPTGVRSSAAPQHYHDASRHDSDDYR